MYHELYQRIVNVLTGGIDPDKPIYVHMATEKPLVGSVLAGSIIQFAKEPDGPSKNIHYILSSDCDNIIQSSDDLGGNLFFVKTRSHQYFIMVFDSNANKHLSALIPGENFPALTFSTVPPHAAKSWRCGAITFRPIEKGFLQDNVIQMHTVDNVKEISTTCFLVSGYCYGHQSTDPGKIFDRTPGVPVTHIVVTPSA